MSELHSEMYQVSEILGRYIAIHDKIFKFPLRKVIPIFNIFKHTDYGQHFRELGSLVSALEQVANSASNRAGVPSVFQEYVKALHKAMQILRDICKQLYNKSQGYSMQQYKSDVAMYEGLVEEYRSLRLALNEMKGVESPLDCISKKMFGKTLKTEYAIVLLLMTIQSQGTIFFLISS